MQRNALLLSVCPRYAEGILEGQKTVELRRVRPRACDGAILLIYVSSPVKALKAISLVEGITAAEPAELWKRVAHKAGISRAEFDEYFTGVDVGFAIHLKDVLRLSHPLPLAELRELWPGFHPPQCYQYFTGDELSELIGTLGSVGIKPSITG